MSREITTIPEEMSFRNVVETISYSKNFYFPVIDREGNMTGILSFNDIREMMFEEGLLDLVVASTLATQKVEVLVPENNLNEAMEIFARLDVDQIPVVRTDSPKKVIGMVNRGDVIATYNREVLVHNFDK
jgi:CIC family chloride channel protein